MADVQVLCLTQLPVKRLIACWGGAPQCQPQMGKPQPASNCNPRVGCLVMLQQHHEHPECLSTGHMLLKDSQGLFPLRVNGQYIKSLMD